MAVAAALRERVLDWAQVLAAPFVAGGAKVLEVS
jgi:hypothetical protein